MGFDKKDSWAPLGEKLGYLFMYAVFTTLLYFLLTFINKIPRTWKFGHIAVLTLIIVITGILMQKVLK